MSRDNRTHGDIKWQIKKRNKGKTKWFGETLSSQQIADRYGVHRVTVTNHLRAAKKEKNPNSYVLARLTKRKRGPYSKTMKNLVVENPRTRIEDIPSPTEYERGLWGY